MDTSDLAAFAPPGVLADFMDGLSIMDGRGLTEGFGHLSARLESGFLITPALAPGLARPNDLIVVAGDGGTLHEAKGRKPALETPLHLAIYRARPDVGALCRTHSPWAVAWGLRAQPFRPTHGFGLMLGEKVPYHRDGDLITSPRAGASAASALGASRALFLKGNGLVVTGATIREAVIRALFLEEACRATLCAGRVPPGARFSKDQREARSKWHDAELARAWGYYSARASTRHPK
jgi:HCOMODA/2-hydroxy-3-carboxy-muconic semialdehyde decarboxylase